MENNIRKNKVRNYGWISFLLFFILFAQSVEASGELFEFSNRDNDVSVNSINAMNTDFIYNQDGFGFSGLIPARPLGPEIEITGYQDWPTDFIKESYAFMTGLYDGENVWMIPFHTDQVIKVNRTTGQMTGFDDWPSDLHIEADSFFLGSFRGGVFDGENIWMIPYNADQVVKLDTKTGEMTGYNNWPTGFTKSQHAFSGGIYDGKNIWMIPTRADRVVQVDTETGEMTGYDNWPDGITGVEYPFASGVFDGKNVWMIPYNADQIVKLDTETGEMTGYTDWPAGFTKVGAAFSGGAFDGENVWMTPFNTDQAVKLNTITGEMISYDLPSDTISSGGSNFQGTAFDGQSVWLFPYTSGNSVVRIDKSTGHMSSYNNWPTDFTKGLAAFASGVFDGESIWMIPYSADRLIKLSPKPTYSIEAISNQEMKELNEGYQSNSQEVKTITVNKSGTGDLNNLAVALSETDPGVFEISQPVNTTLNNNIKSTTFTIKARDGLPVGTYTALVTVSADKMDDVTFTVTQVVAETTTSTLNPKSATFDKNSASSNYADVTTEVTWNGNSLSSIRNGENVLVLGTDYTVKDNTVSLKKEYLTTQPLGTLSLTFIFSAGENQTMAITIGDTTRSNNGNSGGGSGGGKSENNHFITNNGATISFNSGQIIIPKGAWDRSFRLTINELSHSDVMALTNTLSAEKKEQFVSNVIELKKDKIGNFQKAVTLNLEFAKENISLKSDEMKVSLYWLNEVTNQWEELDNITVDWEKDIVSGTIDHFTKFAVIASQLESEEPVEEPKPDSNLTDISGHWAEGNIRRLAEKGLITGYPDGRFQPDKSITRSEFVQILVNGFQLTSIGESDRLAFSDVEKHWAQEKIAIAYAHGIINGYNETTFGPNDPITREQMTVMLVNALQLEPVSSNKIFADQGSISPWAEQKLLTAVENGIIDGYPDQTIRPKSHATRAEVVTVMLRVLEKK